MRLGSKSRRWSSRKKVSNHFSIDKRICLRLECTNTSGCDSLAALVKGGPNRE